jgi:3-methyl-2-oxobutanoate hydroxymethyltransferase
VVVPTIGIGGSPACDGQILVIDDMLGLFTEFTPKFVKQFRRLGDEIRAAAREYAEEARQARFSRKWRSVDEEFVPDSPLEEAGFELPVPR